MDVQFVECLVTFLSRPWPPFAPAFLRFLFVTQLLFPSPSSAPSKVHVFFAGSTAPFVFFSFSNTGKRTVLKIRNGKQCIRTFPLFWNAFRD